jgi:serine/threonine-protein kinase HipA
MRKAEVYLHNELTGYLEEVKRNNFYVFSYLPEYRGEPISLTMPVSEKQFSFSSFPPFFDGLLPEGIQLDGLLRNRKLDKDDYFSQLMEVGGDLIGAVTVKEIK